MQTLFTLAIVTVFAIIAPAMAWTITFWTDDGCKNSGHTPAGMPTWFNYTGSGFDNCFTIGGPAGECSTDLGPCYAPPDWKPRSYQILGGETGCFLTHDSSDCSAGGDSKDSNGGQCYATKDLNTVGDLLFVQCCDNTMCL